MKKIIIIIAILCITAGCQKESRPTIQAKRDTALADTIKTNDIEKIKNLELNKGVNGYYDYKTALTSAVEADNIEAVKYFINQGANVNLKSMECRRIQIKSRQDRQCLSPLQIAKKKGNKEMIELLIAHGAKE